jgi:membrane fusion protein (multidrug efflux system)
MNGGKKAEEPKEKGTFEGSPPSQPIRKWPWIVMAIIVASGLAGGYWWFFMRGRVTTDDAYIRADSASISSRIDGTVSMVLVDNNQAVKEGQILVQLDPRDYQVAVDREAAILARFEAEIKAAEITVSLTDSQTEAQLEASQASLQRAKNQEQAKYHQMEELEKKRLAAQANFRNTEKEFRRYEKLYGQGATSEQKRDDALTAFKKAEAGLKAEDAGIEATKASLDAIRQEINQAKANLKIALSDREKVNIQRHNLESLEAQASEARAQSEQAKLNLSYCAIKAPLSGFIAQKGIQVGDHVKSGQPMMAVVPLDAAYVEANFKETQLEHVRVGQPATIRPDIYPGYTYHGTVVGIGAGTGAAFSLLPPENATGNWIKIVQRIPVKIAFDSPPPPHYPVRVGLSLTVTIDFGK